MHNGGEMEIILENLEIKQCIMEEKDEPDDNFKKQDKKCKSVLIQCVANNQLELLKCKNTSFQMWKALEDVFQRKGMASQLYLRKKLLTMKYRESERIENYFIKFDEVVRELKSVGAKLEDVDIVCHLLLTLPKSFDPIVTALETLEPARLTLEFVKGKLLDHEAKRVNDPRTGKFVKGKQPKELIGKQLHQLRPPLFF
ncbi:hypothetical protein QE152_g38802 [Popillia japonica]|uniref:Retrovirus-related Pol polyprotein from transposon TNT 1-94 n=1 Tax=Popillia japonica TaxID=7064 RepID=A0AAW1HWL2_POPJA